MTFTLLCPHAYQVTYSSFEVHSICCYWRCDKSIAIAIHILYCIAEIFDSLKKNFANESRWRNYDDDYVQ